MKLSIITINYNNKAGLEKTAASIISQTWRCLTPSPSPEGEGSPWEWIIIDGGSTDGSREVIESLTTNPLTSNLISYWCSEPDKGIYNAMNKGIAHAKGNYVNFMNTGDTFYNEHVLEDIMPYISECKADVLYGNVSNVYSDHSEIKMFPERLSFRWLYNDTINHQASFCKLEKLKSFMFDETYRIMADRKLWLQLYLHGGSFKYVPMTMVSYDHTGDTWTSGEKWLNEFNRLHSEIIPSNVLNHTQLTKMLKLKLELQSRVKRLLCFKCSV